MSASLPLFFGYTTIAIASIGGLILLFRGRSKASTVSFCVALATIGFACSYLPYLQKIEIGVIKIQMAETAPHVLALEREATALNEEVNKRKQELDALSKRSDGLQKANNASQERIKRLEQQEELKRLQLQAGILKDRDALDELEKLSNDKNYLENETARSYWNQVLNSIASQPEADLSKTMWVGDVGELTVVELDKKYWAAVVPIENQFVRIGIIQTLDKRPDISSKDKLQFLQKIIDEEKNIEICACAGRHFIQIAGLAFSPLARRELLGWWKDNADKVR